MQIFKLTKEDKVLYVEAIPQNYFAASYNGWIYELIEVEENTTLNTLEEIN